MIFGALVVILMIIALAFMILPVLRKPAPVSDADRETQNISIAREKKQLLQQQLKDGDMSQEEFDAGIADLETSLAIDLERQQKLEQNQQSGTWVIWIFAVLVPVFSFLLYAQLGNYQVIENPALAQPRTAPQQNPAHANNSSDAPSIEEMIERVKQRLRDQPDDIRGWFILGRTYMSMRQYQEAVTALQRAYELDQSQPPIMLALADALAMTHDGTMGEQAENLVKKALQLAPNDPTALWLGGLAAEQNGRFREAYDHWTKLLPLLTDDPDSTQEVKILLAELRNKQPDLPAVDGQAEDIASTTSGLKVSVTLDPRWNAEVEAGQLLYIYAKAEQGPPMPLAAKRLRVSDLPAEVILSDSDAMMANMSISAFDRVVVGARISKTGNPIAQPGDLFTESGGVAHKGFDGVVELTIDQVKQ